MPRETFVERNFSAGSLDIIKRANLIIREYQDQGFTLTLRQLYYQFVARALLENRQTEYKRLGSIINDARLAGMIDWTSIEDRTRNVRKPAAWDDPSEIVSAVADQYQEDLWANQDCRVEVWIEKDALIGVIEPVCERHRLPFLACRGYTSQSEQWRAGKRFEKWRGDHGQKPIVLYLGDHDPSGIDMTRDHIDRLSMFAGETIEVRRLALNMPQVERYNPPPNPAKETDSRSTGYIERFGDKSWELDALDPRVIDRLIDREVKKLIDDTQWAEDLEAEELAKSTLQQAAANWKDIETFLRERE